jgi:Holliday junction resolvase RusA-like endonuclease
VGPRTLVSRGGRLFRERVRALLAARRVTPLAGPLAVEVELYPPDRRRRDIDNALKALLDALQHGGAYADDGQVVRLTVSKRDPAEGGKALVRVRNA